MCVMSTAHQCSNSVYTESNLASHIGWIPYNNLKSIPLWCSNSQNKKVCKLVNDLDQTLQLLKSNLFGLIYLYAEELT